MQVRTIAPCQGLVYKNMTTVTVIKQIVFQVIVGTNTTVSLVSIIEKLGRMDSEVKNFEQKLSVKVIQEKPVNSGEKRAGHEDHNETKAKVTKEDIILQAPVWEKINHDTETFLNKTTVITNQNKHIYLDLLKRSEENGNCMRKKFKAMMYSLWGTFSS